MLAQLDRFDAPPAAYLLLRSFYSHFWALPMHMFIDHIFTILDIFFRHSSNEQFPPSHSHCMRRPLEQLLV